LWFTSYAAYTRNQIRVHPSMENIQSVLELFRNRLNSFLAEALHLNEDVVVLSNLTASDGASSPQVAGKVVLSLANIEQNMTLSPSVRGVSSGHSVSSGQDALPPPVFSDLYLLVLANFGEGNYPSGLNLISRVIGFVRDNPIFTQSNLPGLDPAIDRLSFEFVNLDASQWSHYLRMAGVTYLPAVMYKLRMHPSGSEATPAHRDQ
jgi:hypothetical protein